MDFFYVFWHSVPKKIIIILISNTIKVPSNNASLSNLLCQVFYNVDQLLPIAFISNKLYSQLHFLFRKVEKGNQQSSKAGFPAIFWGALR